MAKATINVGTNANDGTGDDLRSAMISINANFTELYEASPVSSQITIAGNKASPSFDIALPISAENGIYPFKYNVAVKICGPHPGIKPTKIAIKGVSGKITSNNFLKSNPVK